MGKYFNVPESKQFMVEIWNQSHDYNDQVRLQGDGRYYASSPVISEFASFIKVAPDSGVGAEKNETMPQELNTAVQIAKYQSELANEIPQSYELKRQLGDPNYLPLILGGIALYMLSKK